MDFDINKRDNILEGISKGKKEMSLLFKKMKADGKIKEYAKALDDEELYKRLLLEYGIK